LNQSQSDVVCTCNGIGYYDVSHSENKFGENKLGEYGRLIFIWHITIIFPSLLYKQITKQTPNKNTKTKTYVNYK